MPMTDGQWFLFKGANGNQVWICAVCGCALSASSSPFCVGMKTGPLPQDLLIVKAVVPNHKDLATIQLFKMWTNVGTEHAFSNTTRQFIDAEVANLIKDMIKG
eukprot:1221581-Karenia_brevis.AAC.1